MLKENALKDKIIVVTGGGTGLGKAMSGKFLSLGAKVIITSRKLEVLEKTAGEFAESGFKDVFPLKCDIRNYEEIEEMLSKSVEKFGAVNVLLNNAAGNFISPTERLSHRAFDIIVDIVLKGTYYSTLAFGKHWIKNKQKGTFLNIITTYAFTGSGYVVPSACAKGGVLALTRSLAVEWAKYGIRSNAIAPGPFPTKGAWQRLLPGELMDKFDMTKKIPLGRMGEKEELADLAAYLVSEYSAFMNGEVVTIDGGEWLKGAGEFNMLEMIPDAAWDNIEKMIRQTK